MAVDRQAREKLAAVITAFMRDEVEPDQFTERIIEAIPEETEDATVCILVSELLEPGERSLAVELRVVPEERWDLLRRTLAYLQTDYEWRPPDWSGANPGWKKCPRFWNRLGIGLMAGGFLTCFLVVKYGPLIGIDQVWAGLFVFAGVFGVAAWAHADGLESASEEAFEQDPMVHQSIRHFPFKTYDDWRAHERLLLPLDLPPYVDRGPMEFKSDKYERTVTNVSRGVGFLAALLGGPIGWLSMAPKRSRLYMWLLLLFVVLLLIMVFNSWALNPEIPDWYDAGE